MCPQSERPDANKRQDTIKNRNQRMPLEGLYKAGFFKYTQASAAPR